MIVGKPGTQSDLPARQHPRCHLHFTPTSASWLNQVERWFGLISQGAVKRGSFGNVPRLVGAMETFIKN